METIPATESTEEALRPRPTIRVLVAGAGPGGLLAAINLLKRNNNDDSASPRYHITLVDGGDDYGLLSDEQLKKARSWQIGLAWPGLRAIRRVPNLYEEHVSKVGVPIRSLALYIGARKFASASGDEQTDSENYLVDRNFVVAALARHLHAHHRSGSAELTLCYKTRVLFVDQDERRVFVRSDDGSERYVPYDLLIGADGARSTVRAAFVAAHRDFECKVEDIFESFKAVHIELPEGVEPNCMHVLPSCMRNMNGIGLVETDNRINLSFGHRLHAVCDDELLSDDPAVVAAYFRKHFKAFPLPYDEVARAWVGQQWNSTTKTYCSQYHSTKLQAVILGDAAHATSPSIGMGMNHALGDAAVLDELLDKYTDDLATVLPEFSALRVKEGQALTDVADLIQSYSSLQTLYMTARQAARGLAHYLLGPKWVDPEPYVAIGNGMKLSEAYAILTRTGRLPAIQRHNAEVKRRFYAEKWGMVPSAKRKSIGPST